MSALGPLRLLVIVVVCTVLDGISGLLIGVAIAGALAVGVTARALLLAAAATIALAGAHALLVGLPDASEITVRFVSDRTLTHHLAFGAAALLVVGVLVDERRMRAEPM